MRRPDARRAPLNVLVRSQRVAWIHFARGLVGASDAEDVVHEAIMRIWRAQAGDHGAADRDVSEAYVRTVIRNLATNRLRDQVRRRALEREHRGEIVEACSGSLQGQWERIRRGARREQVEDLLRGLPPAEANAVRLFFIEELGAREVATRAGWTFGTAWTLRTRGLRRLRDSHRSSAG